MNSISQLDIHPDAESLNAFVEQALPEGERGQILAHLAACGRCRQVVYLAQEAAGPLPIRPAEAQPAGSRMGSWFGGWRLAWIPAAALAALVSVAVLVQVRRAGPGSQSGQEAGSEMAKVAPQSAPQNAVRTVEPSQVSPAPASADAAKPLEKKAGAATAPPPSRELSAKTGPSAPPAAEYGSIATARAEGNGIALSPGAALHGVAAAQFKPESPAASPQPQHTFDEVSNKSTDAPLNETKVGGIREGAEVSSAQPVISSQQTAELRTAPAKSLALARKGPARVGIEFQANSTKLPSGLVVQSTATAQHRTLAIDLAGSLFLSADLGTHWEPVARQWSGRAVVVRVRQGLKVNGAISGAAAGGEEDGANGPASGGPATGTTAAPSPRAGVFELETDNGLAWVSADGKTWNAQ